MSTRIIGGDLGGRRIKTPPGDKTRPTTDRVKEAIFSALEARWGSLGELVVLDLYAGSGSLGFEALSRGADHVVFCEHDASAAAVIRDNARTLGAQVTIWSSKAERALAEHSSTTGDAQAARGGVGPFDLVFVDPPYDVPNADLVRVLAALADGWLGDGADVVVERSARSVEPDWPVGLRMRTAKSYGETKIWYLEKE